MKKKTKAPQRCTELERIAARVHTALRSQTKNVIEIGKLLIESRKHLEHGEWQSWLAENFDLSYHTARNYVTAAEYVARQKLNGSIFGNLAPTVLYRLAEGDYSEQEEAEFLAQAKAGKRIDQDAARAIAEAICEKLAPADEDDDDDQDQEDSGDEKDAESEAILDGPPPAVPPPAPIPPPTDFALRDFDEAINALKRLKTKPSAQFAQTIHSADDLEAVESFIHAVMKTRRQ